MLGIGLPVLVTHVDGERVSVTERVRDTETVFVKGLVLGIGLSVLVTQLVGERVNVTERVRDTETVFVKGFVLGIGLPETVIEVESVGSWEAATVINGVTDRVIVRDRV